ncbi:unnamed protein product [Prunus armeniaca]|uniref:Oxidoreductase N-terminal domain-containing protein n=1 Tax=Prunus armeniaca TaxID=36596 RepID=A0A6J5VIU0_PRUAR|nr:unnamed protein product [Prunus armeniaca]
MEQQQLMSNKQVILREYVSGRFPTEADMYVNTSSYISLKVPPQGSTVLVKNLYLSCDPMMRFLIMDNSHHRMTKYVYCTPGSPIYVGMARVAKVLDSSHPEFKQGDLVWGLTRWEEYSFITNPESLIKIRHTDTDVPLSYYTGILGK